MYVNSKPTLYIMHVEYPRYVLTISKMFVINFSYKRTNKETKTRTYFNPQSLFKENELNWK